MRVYQTSTYVYALRDFTQTLFPQILNVPRGGPLLISDFSYNKFDHLFLVLVNKRKGRPQFYMFWEFLYCAPNQKHTN